MSEIVELLAAAPHQWGKGAIHLIDQESSDKTLCGQRPGSCPGKLFHGKVELVTCKACLRSIEAKANWARREVEWQQELKRREQEKAAWEQAWWEAYPRYLESQVWKAKRALVLKRAKGVCEGCLKANALQVHHLVYPKDSLPGTDEWLRQEKLFSLVAVCLDCHKDLHPEP